MVIKVHQVTALTPMENKVLSNLCGLFKNRTNTPEAKMIAIGLVVASTVWEIWRREKKKTF